MIEVEIINANFLPLSSYRDSSKTSFAIDTFIVLKYYGKEVARTSLIANSYEPIWNEKFIKTYSELNGKERINNRPFYLEYFDVEVYECSPTNAEKSTKIYEARIPLTNIGLFKSYKLLKTFSSSESKHDNMQQYESCRVFVRLNRYFDSSVNDGSHVLLQHIPSFNGMPLVEVLSPKSVLYRHLYMDFHNVSTAFTYRTGLLGPTCGELLIDRYSYVEVSPIIITITIIVGLLC